MKTVLASLTALLVSFSSITIHAQQAHTLKGTAAHMAGRKVELLTNRDSDRFSVDK